MKDGGTAIMGSAAAEGEGRSVKAVSQALASPLLNDNDITGANYILLNITSGDEEVSMDEIDEITDYIQNEAGNTADIIWGNGVDESLGNKISVTIIATGFGSSEPTGFSTEKKAKKVVRNLDDEVKTNITQKLDESEGKTEETPSDNEPSLKKNDQQKSFEFTIRPKDEPFKTNTPSSDKPVKRYSLDDEIEDELESDKKENQILDKNKSQEKPSTSSSLQSNGNDDSESSLSKSLREEDQLRKSQDRILKLKALSLKMKSPGGINDLEKEPAYKRRNITLDDTPHSSESNVSRYTLSEDEDKKTTLKQNNSFLHDNVD